MRGMWALRGLGLLAALLVIPVVRADVKVSPDGRNKIVYERGEITVSRDGKVLLGPQAVSLTVDRGQPEIELCARNDGVAYRFRTNVDGEVTVSNEIASLVFPSEKTRLWVGYNWCDNPGDPKQDKLQHGCASIYTRTTVGEFVPDKRRIAYLPLLAQYADGTAVWVSESDLHDYPGWNLVRRACEDRRLDGEFARAPISEKDSFPPVNYRRVTARRADLARTRGCRTYPWRIFAIVDRPIALVESTIVRDLARPPAGDFSWVKPGLCAWEWWNDWKLENVGFASGINHSTYLHYIDFAVEFGLPYLMVDEGWCERQDPMKPLPELRMTKLIRYAAERDVGVFLWVPWRELIGRQEEVFSHWAAKGVKGFKVDFIERDDQYAVRFMEETASVAARHRLMIDYHGCSKPAGIDRTYPNVVGLEGVHGLELMKLDFAKNDDFPTHDCQVVYTRVPAGACDYTPGGMRQVPKRDWKPDMHRPATQGTRAHQLALYVLFPAPLQMMCDSPSQYRKNRECARFISSVPTAWDETRGLDGEVGRFAAVARRKAGEWWLGVITDGEERHLELDTVFLGEGIWEMEMFGDASDCDRHPDRYVRKIGSLRAGDKLRIDLAADGGGCAARFTPKNP